MKFVPRHSQIVGRMVIRRSDLKIILVDETKVTKFVLVDAVGDGAAASGVKVGDVVVPTALSQIVLEGGTCFRPLLEEKNVACFVTGLTLEQLSVQTENGTQYVPFNSPDAAKPLGENPWSAKQEATDIRKLADAVVA